MRFLIILSALCLGACATKYQEMGFSGGVSAQQITANTFRIVARGNGYTDRTTVQDYAMLKAAETTKRNGGTHFMLVGAEDASRVDQIVTPGSAHTTYSGNYAYTSFSPAMAHSIFKPGQDAYIRVIKLGAGEAPPRGAIAADEVITFVGSRVERG